MFYKVSNSLHFSESSSGEPLVPSLLSSRGDPIGLRGWGILAPSRSASMGPPPLPQCRSETRGSPKMGELLLLFYLDIPAPVYYLGACEKMVKRPEGRMGT